jgi:hypothetical protein
MPEETLDVLIDIRAQGRDAINDLKDSLNDIKDSLSDLRDQAVLTDTALMTMSPALFAQSAAAQASTAATSGNTTAWYANIAAVLAAAPAWLQITLAIAAAALVLAPFVLLLVGAIVIMSAFVVGMTAVALSLGIAGIAIGGLIAAVVLLADRLFTTGKTAVDPLIQLEQHISAIADAWGKLATPMAMQFINALNQMLPLVQNIGTSMLEWFGGRIPQILNVLVPFFQLILADFQLLGIGFGGFIDQMLQRSPQFVSMTQMMLSAIIGMVFGILTNLLRLDDWFTQRLPAMAPIVGSIMGAMGSFIQGFGNVAGAVVDWFITHWPQITAAAQSAASAIGQGYAALIPIIQFFLAVLSQMGPILQFITQHSEVFRMVLLTVGVAIGVVVAIALILIGTLIMAAAVVGGLYDAMSRLYQFISGALVWAFQSLYWHISIIPGPIGAVGGAFGWLASVAIGHLNQIIGAVSHLVGMIQWAAGAVGRFASQASSAVSIAQGIGSFMGFQEGGVVPGPMGAPMLAVVHGGETVVPPGQSTMGAGGKVELTSNITLVLDDRVIAEIVTRQMAKNTNDWSR